MPYYDSLKEALTVASGNAASNPTIPQLLGYGVTDHRWWLWFGNSADDLRELATVANVRPICLVNYSGAHQSLELPDFEPLVHALLKWCSEDPNALPVDDIQLFLKPIQVANENPATDDQSDLLP